jgi:transposase
VKQQAEIDTAPRDETLNRSVQDQRRHAQLLAIGGVRADDIATSLGVSRATVYRTLAEVAA